MLDRHLHPLSGRLMDLLARPLARLGASADGLTLAGFLIGVLAVPCLAAGFYGPALILILLNRLCDGLDGALARHNGPSRRGAFLDVTLDFIFYALPPLGFAAADPSANALAAAALLTGFIGTGTSFLALAAAAEKQGLTAADYPRKGIYYIGGLTEGFETILFFVVACLWPGLFAPLAWIFAALCLVTTFMRFIWGLRILGP